MLPDIICIQEIHDILAYNDLAATLPAYSFISTNYNDGFGLDLGIAVRSDCGEITSSNTLFPDDDWSFAWRYPLKADIAWHCGTAFLNLEVINVHFKAYNEGFDQRLAASGILSDYIDANPNINIVIAGDFNDEIDEQENNNSLWIFPSATTVSSSNFTDASRSCSCSSKWNSWNHISIKHLCI